MTERVLSFGDACGVVAEHSANIRALASERVPLLECLGRVLAAPLVADRDLPPFHRSTRDGFAVRAADAVVASAKLKIIGELRAGATFDGVIGPGQAVEIMTGAGVPTGADAVVMVEYTSRDGDTVVVQRTVERGENVVPRGSEAAAGQVLVPAGTRVDAAVVAVAASVGMKWLEVRPRPRVAILATGDELVDIDANPGPSEIRNSNSYSLAAQVNAAGGEAVRLPIARDAQDAIRAAIGSALTCDLLVLAGGVSMGKYDFVEDALREHGADFLFTGAKIQPGKPIVFGSIPRKEQPLYFFGLPGNPVSTMVTFALFVRPMLDALSGALPAPPRFVHAKLQRNVQTKTGLTRFLPAKMSGTHAATEVELLNWQGSGDMVTVATADCFVVIPPDREQIAAGEIVSVLLK